MCCTIFVGRFRQVKALIRSKNVSALGGEFHPILFQRPREEVVVLLKGFDFEGEGG